jgi:hypothetical protein
MRTLRAWSNRACKEALVVTGVAARAVLDGWRRCGRVHPANLIGGTVVVVSLPLRIVIGYTVAWQAFGIWIAR